MGNQFNIQDNDILRKHDSFIQDDADQSHDIQFRRAQHENVNIYTVHKTVAQGVTNMALFSANASQLKRAFDAGVTTKYFLVLVPGILVSLILQVVIGVLLVLCFHQTRSNRVTEEVDMRKTTKVNRYAVILVLFVSLINIIISVFDGIII